jgi:hypothetical protein
MKLTYILKKLRAIKTTSQTRAFEVLGSGLGVEALPLGAWAISRAKVYPSDKECSIVARDAGIESGFSVSRARGRHENSQTFYCKIMPLEDDPDFSTHDICPACHSRSLLDDNSGGGTYCPNCGHGTEAYQDTSKKNTVDVMQNNVFETVMAYFGYSLEDGVWTGQLGSTEAEQFALSMGNQIRQWSRGFLQRVVLWLETGGSVGAIFHAVPERAK